MDLEVYKPGTLLNRYFLLMEITLKGRIKPTKCTFPAINYPKILKQNLAKSRIKPTQYNPRETKNINYFQILKLEATTPTSSPSWLETSEAILRS